MKVSRSTLNWGRGGAARKKRFATWSVHMIVSKVIVCGCEIVSVYCLIFERAQWFHLLFRAHVVCLLDPSSLTMPRALPWMSLMRYGSSAITVAGAVPSEERRAAGGPCRARREHCSCILKPCCEIQRCLACMYMSADLTKGEWSRNAHFNTYHSARPVHAQCTLSARLCFLG